MDYVSDELIPEGVVFAFHKLENIRSVNVFVVNSRLIRLTQPQKYRKTNRSDYGKTLTHRRSLRPNKFRL